MIEKSGQTLGAFLRERLLDPVGLEDTRVLSRKTVDLMAVDHTGDIEFRNGQGFGLGLFVVTDPGANGLPILRRNSSWST